MIESIEFSNFKALRKTSLPLAPFTLLLGPNGSGKSSVLQALQAIATFSAQWVSVPMHPASRSNLNLAACRSISAADRALPIDIQARLRFDGNNMAVLKFRMAPDAREPTGVVYSEAGIDLPKSESDSVLQWLARMQVFALDAVAIAEPAAVESRPLLPNGAGLVALLDDLKDTHPDRWDALLTEMRHWLPEYDYVLFDKPAPGQKAIALRTKKGAHRIPACDLSQGTLIALALLTLAYSPTPPSLIGLEEIDRGLHPRLLRNLQDALYRLSYPESCGEARPPIQVIATTHSPYLLDLYRDHPDEVVLAQKEGLEVEMKRLSDIENYEEILGDSPLSDVWYSGVLGGASVKP